MATCPYCDCEITLENVKRDEGTKLMKRTEIIYSCPRCGRVLTISSSYS